MNQMSKKNHKDSTKDLTIVGHLTELRKRIIYSVVAVFIGILICYYFSEAIIKSIIGIGPINNFVYIAPAELLMSYIKVSVLGGFVISAPLIFIQVWLFVSPGLNDKEKKYIIVSLFIGGIFFILGIIFAYIVVLPTMITFFMGFQIEEIQPMISFSNYLGFVINNLLAFGLIYELPIVMVLLTKFRILKIEFLKNNRKYFVLIILIIAAILTPPDVISQTLLAIPMFILFEIGILLSTLIQKKN